MWVWEERRNDREDFAKNVAQEKEKKATKKS
jgi:hypothetical protein